MLVHHLLVVNARITNPPTDPVFITEWKKKLVEDIGMKILMGPYAVYSEVTGNRGLTAVTIIETSHIALHIWDEDEPGILRLDVYSCAEFDIDTILKAIEQFNPTHVDYKFLDRTGDVILTS
jgi:S-adenosylmethionine/arginine decarboxylase-like enzyme